MELETDLTVLQDVQRPLNRLDKLTTEAQRTDLTSLASLE